MPRQRAIGIVRVSQVAGREGESFISPTEQADRIRAVCRRESLELLEIHDELDVSGGADLSGRHGLSRAVELVECGTAQVVVAAYFDRFFRNLDVQRQVIERVERAGGQVLTVDVGAVSHATAGQWLSATMLGAVSEYARRSAGERSREAVSRAVSRGVLPYANVPPGLRKRADGTLERDPVVAPLVAAAVQMRAEGHTIREIRAFLANNGISRSYHGVQALLASRVLLGEIHFGKLSNLHAHEPIVDRDIWRAAQRVCVPRGRRAKSDRLLARLGVLRCATCGSRMVVGSSHHGRYPIYRCPPVGDCGRRMSISAVIAEAVVTDATRAAIAGREGRASVEADAREADVAAEQAQAALDAAILAFTGLEGEEAARVRLAQLLEERDRAASRAQRLRGKRAALTVTADDWDRLSAEARRALVGAVVERADVGPGRGAGRLRVHLFGE